MAGGGVGEALDPAGTVCVQHHILDKLLAATLQVFADGLHLLAVRCDGLEHRVRRRQGRSQVAILAAQADVAAYGGTVALGEGRAEMGGFLDKLRHQVTLDDLIKGAAGADVELAVLHENIVQAQAVNINEILSLGASVQAQVVGAAGQIHGGISILLAQRHGLQRGCGMIDHVHSSCLFYPAFRVTGHQGVDKILQHTPGGVAAVLGHSVGRDDIVAPGIHYAVPNIGGSGKGQLGNSV